MARRSDSAGRMLALLAAVVGVLVVLMAAAGVWRPALDVDLAGGNRVLLDAAEDPSGPPSEQALSDAAEVVADRVAALDVAGADVFTRGERTVVVEAPGDLEPTLVSTVQQRGRLGIRVVACSSGVQGPCAQAAPPSEADGSGEGGSGDAESGGEGSDDGSTEEATTPTDVAGALMWSAQPPTAWTERFAAATCPLPEAPADEPDAPLVACDDQGVKYLLTGAVVEGTQVDDAEAVQSTGDRWRVQLDLDGAGTRRFGELSQALLQGRQQFAVVLDGRVVTAPTMQGLVADGNPSFSGTFDQRGAQALARTVSGGALPLSFASEPVVEQVTASAPVRTASWAALAGLLAVCLGGFLRYRRAALAGVAGLLVAGALTWSALALLGEGIGLTTGLPTVAALGVGAALVGGGFVALAERVRAGRAAGKSAAAALDDGWPPVRNRRLAGDAAVLLVALVGAVVGTDAFRAAALALVLVAVVDAVVLLLLVRPLLGRLTVPTPAPTDEPRAALPGSPRAWHAITAGLLLLAVLGLVWPGLRVGSDVAGGTEIRLSTPGERPTADQLGDVRDEAASAEAVGEVEVYAAGEGLVVRTDRLDDDRAAALAEALSGVAGAAEASTADVGPTWRERDVTRALVALGSALLLALVALRAWTGGLRPTVAGGVAVLFDLVVVTGVGTLLGLAVSTTTLAAAPVVLAWSLHGKTVVLDRLAEAVRALRRTRGSWTGAVAAGAAALLPTTVGATALVVVPALVVLVAGLAGAIAPAVADLALLLVVGVLVAAWSSLFLTVPLLVRLRAGEKEVRQAERRAAARRTRQEKGPAAAAARTPGAARPARQQARSTGSAKRAQPARQSRANRSRGKGGRR